MKIFRYFMVLVLVVLLLAAAGCGGGKETGDPSGNENGSGAAEENGGEKGDANGGEVAPTEVKVSVTPPEGWEKGESSALIQYTKGPSSFMVVQDRIRQDVDGLEGYLEVAQEKLSETFSKVEFSSVENIKVDGHDSKKFFGTYEVAGMPFKLLTVYVYREGYIYNLQGCALAEDFDPLLPEFEAFISSFRFE